MQIPAEGVAGLFGAIAPKPIIEAKNEDLERGFVQLAVECIALAQGLETERPLLLGAVSTGTIWQVGQFERTQRRITQDLTYIVYPPTLTN